jgi:LEA14-like dessication related protein
MKNTVRVTVMVIIATILVAGCETLRSLIEIQRPSATVESVRIAELSFEDVELIADVRVDNPNAVGISLSGFGYQLDLEGERFLSGREDSGLSIAAEGASMVTIPLRLEYDEIRRGLTLASEQDELAYRVSASLDFELPVIGAVSVPVSQDGAIPVIRLPRIRVTELALDSIGFTGAELSLGLEVENPNAFTFSLDSLDYALEVQNQTWASGQMTRGRRLQSYGRERIELQFSLSFSALGRAVRNLLLGDDEISYAFAGSLVIDPDLPLLNQTTIPLDLAGSIPLSR